MNELDKFTVKIMTAAIGVIVVGVAKVSYEYGRYKAIDQIYKKGWTVCEIVDSDEVE